ncbi:hypothetical protein ACJUAE_002818 [Listeria monocytogenes]
MRDIYLRKVPETTYAFLKDRADAANISVNKYILVLLNQQAVLPEVQSSESKFTELAQVTIDVIQSNNQLFQQVIQVLEGEEN